MSGQSPLKKVIAAAVILLVVLVVILRSGGDPNDPNELRAIDLKSEEPIKAVEDQVVDEGRRAENDESGSSLGVPSDDPEDKEEYDENHAEEDVKLDSGKAENLLDEKIGGIALEELERVEGLPDPKYPIDLDFRVNPETGRKKDFVFFLHIPKTGGMTMCSILRENFHPDGHASAMVADGAKPVQGQRAPAWWGGGRYDPNFVARPQVLQSLEKPELFIQMYDKSNGAYGHADVTVERAMGDRNTVFLTMLRKPENQLVSWYYFLQGRSFSPNKRKMDANGKPMIGADGKPVFEKPVDPNHDRLPPARKDNWKRYKEMAEHSHHLTLGSLATNVTLAMFADLLDRLELTNYATRAYAGALPWGFSDFHKTLGPDEWLTLAKARLEKIPWIGLTERFDESLVLLQYEFDVKIPKYSRRNKSVSYAPPPKELMDHISELQYIDRELYKFAEELFERRYKAMLADCEKRGVDPPSVPSVNDPQVRQPQKQAAEVDKKIEKIKEDAREKQEAHDKVENLNKIEGEKKDDEN